MRELVLRARAVLRRGAQGETDVLQEKVGPLRIDPGARRAFVANEEVLLTAFEFKLLASELQTPNRSTRTSTGCGRSSVLSVISSRRPR
jgi:two-component system response regulator CpxR